MQVCVLAPRIPGLRIPNELQAAQASRVSAASGPPKVPKQDRHGTGGDHPKGRHEALRFPKNSNKMNMEALKLEPNEYGGVKTRAKRLFLSKNSSQTLIFGAKLEPNAYFRSKTRARRMSRFPNLVWSPGFLDGLQECAAPDSQTSFFWTPDF